MKPELFIFPVATVALFIASGCQSGSHDSTKHASVGAGTAAAPVSMNTAATSPVPEKVALPTIRINAGAGAVNDSAGNQWLAETGMEGGDVIERTDQDIGNTKQPEIYRSEHYSMDAFSHKLPNGKYQVKLHFCETYEGVSGPGDRVFTLDVEGKAIKDFDVWAKAGGFAKAYVETVDVNVTDGKLDIKFTPQVENPQINAIEIIPGV
jgi:hypothetical protein